MSYVELFGGAAPGEMRRRDLWSLSQTKSSKMVGWIIPDPSWEPLWIVLG